MPRVLDALAIAPEMVLGRAAKAVEGRQLAIPLRVRRLLRMPARITLKAVTRNSTDANRDARLEKGDGYFCFWR